MAEPLDIRWSRPLPDGARAQHRDRVLRPGRWHVSILVVVDRWFPSSTVCSECGALRSNLFLDVRTWRCRCGAVHDRDVNAARNISAAGLALLACGDGVRPVRAEAHAGSRR